MESILKQIENNQLFLEVNKSIYSQEAINQATYRYTDKCFIFIKVLSDDTVGIYFKSKDTQCIDLETIANHFCNELLDQQVRLDVEARFGNIRDELVKKAFSSIDR